VLQAAPGTTVPFVVWQPHADSTAIGSDPSTQSEHIRTRVICNQPSIVAIPRLGSKALAI